MRNAEDEIIGALYEASTDASRWVSAVRILGDHLHCPAGGLYSELHAETQSVIGLDALYGYSQAALADYVDYYCTRNPFNRPPRKFQVGEVSSDSLIERQLDLGCSFHELEFYRDWARPQKLRHILGQYVTGAKGERLIAAYWRPADAGPYTAEEGALFERAMRHTRRARSVGQRLKTLEGEMEAMLGRLPSAVFTLGRDGRLRQANQAANALLSAGQALRSEGGRLRTAIAQDQAMLDRLIAWALDPRSASLAEEARLPIRRSDGRAPLTLRAIAVAHRFDPFHPDRSASVILTVEGVEDEGLDERLRHRFGFSRAETRVAIQIIAGRSPSEAAAALGLSTETVRSHLKRLYAQTGTHRQSELAVLLQREIKG